MLSLSVSVPEAGLAVVAGQAGIAQTFNNIVDESSQLLSDQVYIFGGEIPSQSLLAGEAIMSVEVDFLSDFSFSEPTMLSDDSLPLSALRSHDSFVRFHAASGDTFVDFSDATTEESPTPTASPTSTPVPNTPAPSNTSPPSTTPTTAGSPTSTVTPGFGLSGDGCMVYAGGRTRLVDAWPLLLPSLLVLARRRKR